MAEGFVEAKKRMYEALEDDALRADVGRGVAHFAERYPSIVSRRDVQELKSGNTLCNT